MTREEIMESISLKKRFCKDCSIPIAVFDNPYFMERLTALDNYSKCFDAFETFCSEVERFNNEQEYFEYYNKVKDAAINAIKSTEEYSVFNNKRYDIFPDTEKRSLYVDENNGGLFVSIDMRKANFSALRHFSDKIFGGAETWEDFIGRFTDSLHIKNSKYIRQVILGACNPKRQISYEKYLMNTLCVHLTDSLPGLVIYSLGEDEILIDVEKNRGILPALGKLRDIILSCPDNIGSLVRVSSFTLEKIGDTGGWLKTFGGMELDGMEIEFKCLSADIFHQIVKYYYDEKITQHDLVFYYNGALAKFLKAVDNPWKRTSYCRTA